MPSTASKPSTAPSRFPTQRCAGGTSKADRGKAEATTVLSPTPSQVLEELEEGRSPEEIVWLREMFAQFALTLEKPADPIAAGTGASVRGLRSGPSREAKIEARNTRSAHMRKGVDVRAATGRGGGSGGSLPAPSCLLLSHC